MAKKKVIKSDSGNYKIIQKPFKDDPKEYSTRARRTIKGVLTGAANRKKTYDNYADAELKNLTKRSMLRELGAKPDMVDEMHPTTSYLDYMKKQKAGGSTKAKPAMKIGGQLKKKK